MAFFSTYSLRRLLTAFLTLLSFNLCCQTVSVRGIVTDATTFEPVVFANVVFKGTAIGVKTGFDGRFDLTTGTRSDSIIISFIGYETRTIAVHQGLQELNVSLKPAIYSLTEVTVKPGENPAHKILRKVWENLGNNSPEKLRSYQFENYSRTTVYLRKFGDQTDGSDAAYSEEFDQYAIGTGEENIPALPVFIAETASTSYFLNSPKRRFIEIKATDTRGLAFNNSTMISQLISKQEILDFTGNTILIVDKAFISPLSRSGIFYYRYYLTDSVLLDNRYHCYEIRFAPRRAEDPAFTGYIWIHDSTYALKRISAEVSGKADMNFINRIRIQQEYEPAVSGAWFPVMTRLSADAVNIFATNFSRRTGFIAGQNTDPGFYGSELKINQDSENKNEEFWKTRRLNSLDHTDSLAVSRIDSLLNNRKVRFSARMVEASIKGYYNFGPFEAGPWVMFYNYNEVEGSRLRLGGRTNSQFSKTALLEGYFAYGTRDRHFKGEIKSQIFLSKNHWTILGLQYRDDVERIGSVDEFFSGDGFLTFASTFGGSDKMNRSRLSRIWLGSDILKGLNGRLVFTRETFEPVSPDLNFLWKYGPEGTAASRDFVTAGLGIMMKYQPRAVYIIDGLRRFPVNFNKYPEFSFSWFRGYKNFLGGNFNYDKIVTGVSNDVNLGGFGRLYLDMSFTKVFGTLPYPLLVNPPGNESVFWTGRAFNMMNHGEFVANEAVESFASWHMDGLITNRLPLIRRLNLRTVLSANFIAGSFDGSAYGEGLLPVEAGGLEEDGIYHLSYKRPYGELSYGVENILKFLRVDLVHRLRWPGNIDTRKLGVKFSGVFRF